MSTSTATKRKTNKGMKFPNRKRRTEEELLEDLKKKMEHLEARAKRRRLQRSPGHKKLLKALDLIESAYTKAEKDEQDDKALVYILLDTRKRLASYFRAIGVPMDMEFDEARGRPPAAIQKANDLASWTDRNAHS